MRASLFVGRGRELSVLAGALDDAVECAGGAILVHGDAGIGKTRLVTEFVEAASAKSPAILWGRCLDGGAPAYWPWRQIARSMARATAIESGGGPLGFLLGEPTTAPPQAPMVPPFESTLPGNFWLLDAASEYLVRSAEQRPAVIVLEDLHWADSASVALLLHLVRALARSRLLVICTYRDGGVGDAPLGAALPSLVREPVVRELALHPLDRSDVAAYVRGLDSGAGPDDVRAVANRLHRRSGGNPYFMTEIAWMVSGHGRDMLTALFTERAIPASLGAVLRDRLAELSAETRAFLQVLAVFGRDVDAESAAAIASTSPELAVERIREAMSARVVTEAAEEPGRFRFVHDLVAEALRDMAGADLPSLHRQVAERLEPLEGGDLISSAELAEHWFRAGGRAAAARAVEHARRAAELADRSMAHEDAADLYTLALAAGERAGVDDAHRAVLLLALARARYRAGQIRTSAETCLLAAEVARRTGRPELLAEAALVVQGVEDRSIDATVRQLCEEALAGLGDRSEPLRVRLLAQLAVVSQNGGDVARAQELSSQALELAERIGDTDALMSALHARQMAFSSIGGAEEVLRAGTRFLEITGKEGQVERSFWGHVWRIEALVGLGDMDAVDREIDALAVVAEQTREPLVRWHLLRTQAGRAEAMGQFDEATRLAAAALSALPADQHPNSGHLYMSQLVMVALHTGRGVEEVRERLQRVVPEAPTIVQAFHGRLALVAGDLDYARAVYEQILPRLAALPRDSSWGATMVSAAELAAALGDRTGAAYLNERLEPFKAYMMGGSIGILGPMTLCLGHLSLCLGRDDAFDRFTDAAERSARAGLIPALVQSELGQAEALLRRGLPRDPEKARRLARSAVEKGRRLGMQPAVAEGARVLRTADASSDAAPHLTPREREVAALVAQGLSNRQIAEALFVSERTVETHVQNVLGKLNFHSRAQIAAWAVRERLAESSTPL